MMNNLYSLFVLLAPLIAALLIALPYSFLKEKSYKLGSWVIFAGFLSSLVLLWQLIQNPEPINLVLFNTSWDILPVVQFTIDRLAAVMLTVISGFGTVLYLYSIRYLQQDAAHERYQILLAAKISLQLFMVSSADLITLLAFWQMLGWLLAMLSHNFAHVPTAKSAFRIFITLRLGDLAFLAGVVLAYHTYGTVQFSELFERAPEGSAILATIITLLIFVGAMAKSAQFPLHSWLPESLYGPTPVSALLHAGGINAGGFLLTRLAPLFALSSVTLHFALVIGLITAILGSSMMLVQNDIKKTLAYSTMGQMGYMIMECGLGAFPLAIFHLIAHGLFKANAFLNCGKGIHEARLNPTKAPQATNDQPRDISWVSAFVLSFVIPLVITTAVHYLLGISFSEHQGLFILFLFSWITVSQAIVTLFRLNKNFLTKGSILIGTALIAFLYFLAAEKFTHFLIPNSDTIEAYHQAAELPYSLFLALATLIVLSIVGLWFFSINHNKDENKSSSGLLKANSYLFFMNRLYMEGFTLRLFDGFKKIGKKIDQSHIFFGLFLAAALWFSFGQVTAITTLSNKTILSLLASALLVPLFPFHGLYLSILTKAPRRLARVLCALAPALGVCTMASLVPNIPREFLPAIATLAIIGAAWGSLKALMQNHTTKILSYGGLALYSILWWNIAQTGQMSSGTLFYAYALTLTWTGLYLAWDRVRVRYGNLNLNQIGGLLGPMPRFGICLGLLIMAAVGFPPFSLSFGFLEVLLNPLNNSPYILIAITMTIFAACWYLFKFMQRLLFGGHRADILYEDLSFAEVLGFALVIGLLLIPSSASQAWLMEVIQ